MKAIATTIQGLEEISIREIKELINTKAEILIPTRLIFETNKLEELTYKTQSILKTYELLKKFKFKNLKEIKENIEKINFSKIKEPFAVKCQRKGNHNFTSQEISKLVGEIIYKKFNKKVDLESPTTTIFIDIIDNLLLIGIDYTGEKLSKREYRVKLTPRSINSCLAYSMLRISDYKSSKTLLDPFAKSGEILIEAVLYALKILPQKFIQKRLLFTRFSKYKFPETKIKKQKLNIYCIDPLMANIKNSEINARLAEVNKYIKFSRLDLDWLDTKFKKNSIDKIITFPPFISKTQKENEIKKIYKELFHQANYVLKKTGSITLLSPDKEILKQISKEYNFKLKKQLNIVIGNTKLDILVFQQ